MRIGPATTAKSKDSSELLASAFANGAHRARGGWVRGIAVVVVVGGDGDMEPYQQDSRSLLCSTPKMLLLNPQPLSKAFALTDPEPD